MKKNLPLIEVGFPFLPGMGIQVRAGDAEIDRGCQAAKDSQGLALIVSDKASAVPGGIGVVARVSETSHRLLGFPLVQMEGLGRARVTGEPSAEGKVEAQELEEASTGRDELLNLMEDFLPVLHRQAVVAWAEHGQEITLDQLRQEMPTVETLFSAAAGPLQTMIAWVFGFLEIEDLALAQRLLGLDDPRERLRTLADWLARRPEPQTQGPAAVREILVQFTDGKLPYARMEALPVDHPAVVDELVAGLGHPEWRAVMACVQALGRAAVEQEAAARAVGGLLSHPEESVREAAVKSLGELGRAAAPAVPALLESFRSDGKLSIFKHTFQALTRIDAAADQVVPFLEKFLALAAESRDYHQVFPKLGNPNTAGFVSFYHSEPAGQSDHPYVDPYPDDFSVVEQACLAAGHFARGDDRLFDPLCRMLRVHSSKVIRAAAGSLARLGPRGEQALLQTLRDPAGWKHDNQERVELWRSEILSTLLSEGPHPAGSLPALCREARTDPWLRQALPKSMSMAVYRMSPEGTATAAQALLNAADPLAAELALGLLGSLQEIPADFLPLLLALLDNSPAPLQAGAIRLVMDLPGEAGRKREAFSRRFQAGDLDPQVAGMLRHALGRLGAPQPPPPGILSAPAQLLSAIRLEALPAGYSEIAWVEDNRVTFPWQRVLEQAPPGEWMTDQDEFGVGVLDLDAGSCALYSLPLRFPKLHTGAAGAKRKWQMRAVLAGDMLLSLEDPYSAGGRWGNHNYVYRFSLSDHAFRRLNREAPLEPPAEELESTDHSVCHGELILWIDEQDHLQLQGDSTPYHLDDWEHTPETAARLEAQQAFRERFQKSLPRWQVHPDGPGQIRLERAGRTVRLADVEACLARKEESQPDDLPELDILEALEAKSRGRAVLVLLCTARPRIPGSPAWALSLELP